MTFIDLASFSDSELYYLQLTQSISFKEARLQSLLSAPRTSLQEKAAFAYAKFVRENNRFAEVKQLPTSLRENVEKALDTLGEIDWLKMEMELDMDSKHMHMQRVFDGADAAHQQNNRHSLPRPDVLDNSGVVTKRKFAKTKTFRSKVCRKQMRLHHFFARRQNR
jgi:hypothetical protein